jgi:hypothetical protein
VELDCIDCITGKRELMDGRRETHLDHSMKPLSLLSQTGNGKEGLVVFRTIIVREKKMQSVIRIEREGRKGFDSSIGEERRGKKRERKKGYTP